MAFFAQMSVSPVNYPSISAAVALFSATAALIARFFLTKCHF